MPDMFVPRKCARLINVNEQTDTGEGGRVKFNTIKPIRYEGIHVFRTNKVH